MGLEENSLCGQLPWCCLSPPQLHRDWVQCVRYCPSLEGLFSASTDPGAALVFTDVRGKRESSVFSIDKGVNSFDYSETWNVIGGLLQAQQNLTPIMPLAPPPTPLSHGRAGPQGSSVEPVCSGQAYGHTAGPHHSHPLHWHRRCAQPPP